MRSLRMLMRTFVSNFLEKKFVRDWFGNSLNGLEVVRLGMEFDFGEEANEGDFESDEFWRRR